MQFISNKRILFHTFTGVEHRICNAKVMGSNPAQFCDFFMFIFATQLLSCGVTWKSSHTFKGICRVKRVTGFKKESHTKGYFELSFVLFTPEGFLYRQSIVYATSVEEC